VRFLHLGYGTAGVGILPKQRPSKSTAEKGKMHRVSSLVEVKAERLTARQKTCFGRSAAVEWLRHSDVIAKATQADRDLRALVE